MRLQKTIQMVKVAIFSAVFCVLSPWMIPLPFSPVPVTLGIFVVYLAVALLGAKQGTLSVIIYLLLGLAGLPVFSGFSGGIAVLAGPTGGYAIGYIPCALLTGWLMKQGTKLGGKQRKPGKPENLQQADKEIANPKRLWKQMLWNVAAMSVGMAACYLSGTVWFWIVMDGTYTITQILLVCVIPYLVFDMAKIGLAAVTIVEIRKKWKL